MSDTAAKPPPRHKSRDDWTASEEFNFAVTGRKPENPAWHGYRDEVLRDHGLLDDQGDSDK